MSEIKIKDMLDSVKKAYNIEKLGDLTKKKTKFYEFGGWRQSKRKSEFVEYAHRIAEERGIPGYQRDREDIGVPLGQRWIAPVKLAGTDAFADIDDFQIVNNAAIQQMADDIKRTSIICLDMAHRVLEQRIGETVTPETINHYLECKNHSICGGAIAQENMAEMHPGMTKDAHAKIITSNDELTDRIDPRFLIPIESFPEWQAEKLKDGIGDHTYQVSRIPTIAVRIADGGVVQRWDNTSTTLGFVAAYNLGGGYSAVSDLVLVAKHLQAIPIGTSTWFRRSRGPNEPGGVPVGYLGDFCQTRMETEADILQYIADASALSVLFYETVYFGGYMSGGIGPTSAVANMFMDIGGAEGGLGGMGAPLLGIIKARYGGLGCVKPSFELIEEITHMVNFMFMEALDRLPLFMELLWGGAVRQAGVAIGSALATGLVTGNSLASVIAAHYAYCHIMKEAWGRGGFGAADALEYIMLANSASLRPEEGMVPELRGPNMNMLSLPGHMESTVAGCIAAHAARMDPWILSPIIKVAFSDSDLAFDFGNVRSQIAKGALREFMPDGDRDLIKPAR
jgi:methyl-coenzyme M reductase alpha subunit